MELGCGSFLEMECFYFFLYFIYLNKETTIKYSMPDNKEESAYFCVLLPATLPQPGLG